MSYQELTKEPATRFSRLLLTSSDAELLGARLYHIQGYDELVDALAQQTNARRASSRESTVLVIAESTPTTPSAPSQRAI
jgi:hypothetical protein